MGSSARSAAAAWIDAGPACLREPRSGFRTAATPDLVDEPARAPDQRAEAEAALWRRGHLPKRGLGDTPGACGADRHIHDQWQAGGRRYLSRCSIARLYPDRGDELAVVGELAATDFPPRGITASIPTVRREAVTR